MRLANGIVVDKHATFGCLKFSAMRREVYRTDSEGKPTEEVKERTYDLKSRGQGCMIQVSIPGDVPGKDFPYNAEVDIVNPVMGTVATATFNGADVDWYIKADDIVLAGNQNIPSRPEQKMQGKPEQPGKNEKQ